MDDGIKTLSLHLCATFRQLSAAHFDSIYFRPSMCLRFTENSDELGSHDFVKGLVFEN